MYVFPQASGTSRLDACGKNPSTGWHHESRQVAFVHMCRTLSPEVCAHFRKRLGPRVSMLAEKIRLGPRVSRFFDSDVCTYVHSSISYAYTYDDLGLWAFFFFTCVFSCVFFSFFLYKRLYKHLSPAPVLPSDIAAASSSHRTVAARWSVGRSRGAAPGSSLFTEVAQLSASGLLRISTLLSACPRSSTGASAYHRGFGLALSTGCSGSMYATCAFVRVLLRITLLRLMLLGRMLCWCMYAFTQSLDACTYVRIQPLSGTSRLDGLYV